MNINIVETRGSSDVNRFIRFPKELYRGDKNYVFEPESLQREFLSRKNPFFEHSWARFYLAKSNGRVVGRIASIVNTVHNEIYGENTGFFGFFESVENYDVAKLMLDKVIETHLQNGFQKVRGPTNFTTNDSCGFLISGFDKPPVVLMPYNKEYYNEFLIRYGFRKEIDLSSYYFGEKVSGAPFCGRNYSGISEKISASGISIRNISYKHLEQDIAQLRHVYNESNRNNWGFIPLNEREFRYMALQLRQFVREKMILIAEKEGKQIAYIVSLPDLNRIFSRIHSGKLLPFGFIKYLWYKHRIAYCRILILGVLNEYRNKGIDLILYEKLRQNLYKMGYNCGEACYVMEDNGIMHSIISKIGGAKVNEYRIYIFDLQNSGNG